MHTEQGEDHSSTRRAFVKIVGTMASFVLLEGCKTTRSVASLKEDGAGADDFISLSKTLTGFDELDPALAVQFLADLKAQYGEAPVQALIATYKSLELEGGDLESLIQAQILETEALSGVAGGATMIWYTGVIKNIEVQQLVAVNAYKQSFVWKAIGSKPMGIPLDDLGHWANPPA